MTTNCDFCGLPVARSWWRERDAAADEPVYCCYGCRFAAEVAGHSGQRGASNWLLARLGLSIFLTINVVMFTMALWTRDVYQTPVDESAQFAASLDSLFRYLALLLSLPVLWLLGAPLARGAWQSIRSGVPSTDPLLVVGVLASYVYSAVSVFRGQGQVYFEVGCVVLVMVTLGRWLEATGKLRATEALDALEKLLPDKVRVCRSDGDGLIRLDELQVGDRLRVLAGERFAADGRIVRGRAAIDEQVFTGESHPSIKEPSDAVLSGTLNLDGELLIDVTATANHRALQKLIAAVQAARQSKGRYQRLADRLSHYFLPAVVVIALAAGMWHGAVDGLETGVLTALAVVLIACPCALGLATPLAVWTAIGRAARSQVLFKHGEAVEQLAEVGAVAFDKTGTLTLGRSHVCGFAVAEGESRESVLEMAASLAASSNHTFSIAITEYISEVAGAELGHSMAGTFEDRGGQAMPRRGESPGHRLASDVKQHSILSAPGSAPATAQETAAIIESRTLPGRGIAAEATGIDATVYLGGRRLMEETGQAIDDQLQQHFQQADERGRPNVCVGWDGHVRAIFELDEKLRPEVGDALDACRRLGLKLFVLSGDATQGARRLGDKLCVHVAGGLLPEEKVTAVRRLSPQKTAVAMVGDGINDAPALAAADVGIALGCGADVSRESADVCLLSNDLRRVPWSIGLARATVSTIRQNLFWASSYNILGIALAASGRLNPVWAAAAMVASSVLVIGNSLRLSTWNS